MNEIEGFNFENTMKRIGLISDTHHYLDAAVYRHFETCDEIWHAGDFGTAAIAEALQAFRPLKGVFGNIDGQDIRSQFPEVLSWTCENVNVYMKHIGGYPKRYAPGVKQALVGEKAKLFISGHSHILKVIYDDEIGCLHMNPGAAGNQGWHQVRTLIRFTIDGAAIKDCEVIELGKKGAIK
jgi:putative phosphoesterase